MSHRHAVGWILLIWTLSSALALPNIIYSDTVSDGHMSFLCSMMWPDGRYPISSYDHLYNITILIFTYLVPILTMAILYYKVGKELWGYEAIGEDVEKQRRALKAKKKIVKMMIVVVIIFALCWLPYHAFFVVNYYWPTFQDAPLVYQRCYLFMYWLAMSNSMYNPIIIYFMNSKFRLEFKRVLYFICCCKIYSPPNAIKTTSQLNENMNCNNNNNNDGNYHRTYTQIGRQRLPSNEITRQKPRSLTITNHPQLRDTSPSAGVRQLNGSSADLSTDQANETTIATKTIATNPIEVVVTTHHPRNYDHKLAATNGDLNHESIINKNSAAGQTQRTGARVNSGASEQEPFLASCKDKPSGCEAQGDHQHQHYKDLTTQECGNIEKTKAVGSGNHVGYGSAIRSKVWI